jgi:hypothetical protein
MLNIKNNKVIFTAIFGDHDDLKPIIKQEGFDYIVFTDNPLLKSDIFEVVLFKEIFSDPKRKTQFCKILPHPLISAYDYSIWVDACLKVDVPDFTILIDNYLSDYNFALHAHPIRKCIYEEAKRCIEIKKEKEEIIINQMRKYKLEGFPENYGLNSCSILYRRHTDEVKEFCKIWWDEINYQSKRDQLSFNYVVWKTGLDFYTIPGHVRNSNVDGFTLFPHKVK